MKLFSFAGRRASDKVEDASEEDLSSGDVPAAAGVGAGEDGRSDLLNQICTFLLSNTLAVTPRNLVVAHGIFSGSNLSLARKVFQRQMAGTPIDQKWLDEAFDGHGEAADPKAEFDKFMNRFDKSLSKFSDTAKEASKATSDYTTALERTTRELETRAFNANDISALAGLNRSMLERTRLLEEEMKAREAEATKLKRSLQAARQDATTDHLTGLANRRAFEDVFEREHRDARAAIDSLSVAICDIDHFKNDNDTHGHDTGDRVIQAIAETLKHMASDTVHVSRHGGEEFVMLFRGLTPKEAKERLDRAREAFAGRNLVNKETGEAIGQITFSGGVADVFAHEDDQRVLGIIRK